jgi:hypothetical protein
VAGGSVAGVDEQVAGAEVGLRDGFPVELVEREALPGDTGGGAELVVDPAWQLAELLHPRPFVVVGADEHAEGGQIHMSDHSGQTH